MLLFTNVLIVKGFWTRGVQRFAFDCICVMCTYTVNNPNFKEKVFTLPNDTEWQWSLFLGPAEPQAVLAFVVTQRLIDSINQLKQGNHLACFLNLNWLLILR